MAIHTVALTSNTTSYLMTVNRRRDLFEWLATFLAYGTWGGGTLTYFISPDGGTTKIQMKDKTGVAMSSTANDIFNVELSTGSKNSDKIQIYVTLASATGANLTVAAYDNN